MERIKLPKALLEQIHSEGMSDLYGGAGFLEHVNNGNNCNDINNRNHCDVINHGNNCSVINNKQSSCSVINNWGNCSS